MAQRKVLWDCLVSILATLLALTNCSHTVVALYTLLCVKSFQSSEPTFSNGVSDNNYGLSRS